MKIIDAHAHIMDEMFNEDRDAVIQRCIDNNLELIVNIGYSKDTSYEAVEYANKYDWMYASIGLHPDDCNIENPDMSFFEELAKNPKVVAVGEIGLDYHYPDETNKENQKAGFIKQIELANKYKLPVAIHSRDADMDMLEILKTHPIDCGFVMHCFSSSHEIAKELIKLGGYISFSGVVTFSNARKILEAAKVVPIDKIMVETDCPYLAPEPYRGQRNEPSNVWKTAEKVAELLNMNLEKLSEITRENTKRFYRL